MDGALRREGGRLGHRNADAFLLGMRRTVRRIHDEWPFDVIHAHDWLTYPAGLAVARMTGKPLVVHVHSTEFDRSGEHVNQPIYNIERRFIHAFTWIKLYNQVY